MCVGKRIVKKLFALLLLALALVGCSDKESSELVDIQRDIYQKNEYKTVMVQKGDINPTMNLILKPIDVEEIKYSVNEEDLEVEDVFVDVGDRVKAGQTLITFKSEDLKKSIDKYSSEVVKKELLLSHYKRVNNIDLKDRDEKYGVILKELEDDVALAKLYLEEEEERYSACQIIAKEDGVITYLSKSVLNGVVDPEQTLLIENCGRNIYEAETNDRFDVKIGDIYIAEDGDSAIEMKIVDIKDDSDGLRKIDFEAVDEAVSIASSSLEMQIDKGGLSNAIYVDKSAINKKDDLLFVFVVEKDGFLRPTYVEIGDELGNYIVITRGLEGSEEVAVK